MMRVLGLILMLAAASGSASAAGLFSPPEGCRLEVTVQNRGCTVGQQYRCDADPEGWQHLAIFDEDGMTHISTIDAETRWVESLDPETGLTDTLEDGAEDGASLTELINTGRDDFDFWTLSNTGERLHHVGHDVLTGNTATIDGVTLDETRFQLTTSAESGEVLIQREGQQYISRTMRRFYGGVETSRDWTGRDERVDDSPVLFSFPGETGFGSTTPQFDCDMMMTQASQRKATL